jgi:hypothetical protein
MQEENERGGRYLERIFLFSNFVKVSRLAANSD